MNVHQCLSAYRLGLNGAPRSNRFDQDIVDLAREFPQLLEVFEELQGRRDDAETMISKEDHDAAVDALEEDARRLSEDKDELIRKLDDLKSRISDFADELKGLT